MTRLIALSALMVAFAAVAFGQSKIVKKGPIPSWVAPTNINYSYNKLEQHAEDGYYTIAFNKQVAVSLQTTYINQVDKILNESGIENASEISVTWDPSFQQLTFHSIRIIRGKESIDKLKLNKIKTLHQETDSYKHLYDGSLTALLLLEDTRKGDVIEYSYSLQGMNPAFKGKYADFLTMAFSVPVGQLFYRVLAPVDRPLYTENILGKNEPVIIRRLNEKEYVWSQVNVEPVIIEDNVPGWYEAYPTVAISEYNDWKDIRDWASALFPNEVSIGPALQKRIDAIRNNFSTDEARTSEAIRFVQDEIRYLGIEMGAGSYKPHNPNQIFNQRFGDCKDKTYLLVTMLQAMNISATPVFINTSSKKGIHNWLPSPTAFDHVTVRIKVNGAFYFVDATSNYQRGGVKKLSYPDYQAALILADSSAGLTTIEPQQPGYVEVKESFSIPDMKGAATLKVITTNCGQFADIARSDFANNSLNELKKSYKNFYSAYFEKIKADSISYKDDEQSGLFTVYEYYTIEDFWQLQDGIQKASIAAFVINSTIRRPKEKLRTMPFRITYPANYREIIEVHLPENWNIEPMDENIRTSAFAYKAISVLDGKKLTLTYEYQTFKDHVAPAEISSLLAQYKRIDEKTAWDLTYNTTGISSNRETSTLTGDQRKSITTRILIFFGLLFGFGLFFLVKRNRKRKQEIASISSFEDRFKKAKNQLQ